jgi:hypothetical protein
MMVRAVRGLGLVLVLWGCAAWAWVALLEATVDRAAAPGGAAGSSTGIVELELYVLDLRLAPLLLAVAGVGLLVAPSVRTYHHGVLAMTAALGAVLLAPVAVRTSEAWWGGAVVLAVVLMGIAVFTVRRSVPEAAHGEDEALSLPARMVTASVALVLLCSAFPMELFLDFDGRVLGGLPDGYLRAVPVLEGVLLVSGMIALLLAARRLTWLHAVAAVLALTELVALVSTEKSAALMVLIWVAVVVATGAAVAGERGRVWHRAVPVAASLALLYPVSCYLSLFFSASFGGLPLELNGGEIDYDGVPVFLTGPFSAVLPVLLYLFGSAAFDLVGKTRGGDDLGSHLSDASPKVVGQAVG